LFSSYARACSRCALRQDKGETRNAQRILDREARRAGLAGGSRLLSLSGERKGWALFGIASYKRLQGDMARSPIVSLTGSADQFFGSVGLGYTF